MRLWVDALRSGDYPQAHRTLYRHTSPAGGYDAEDEDLSSVGYCCLGVLCDLAVKNGVDVKVRSAVTDTYYDNMGAFPPGKVVEWAGLADENPLVTVIRERPGEDTTYETESRLSDLNDEEKASFAEIADLIESQFIAKPVAGQPA
jgi:hypothetical protein